jgi:hypothetical protein
MVLIGGEAQVEPHFGPFEDSANLMQDRCMVSIEHTIGSKIIFDAPDVLLGYVGHVKSHFLPFGESVSVDTR